MIRTLYKFKHLFILLILISTFCFSVPFFAYAADNSKAEENAQKNTCDEAYMRKVYIGSSNEEIKNKCWYCRVVIVMTNAYLQAAEASLPTTIELGHVILKWGFLIWLAIFLLKQLSSMSGVTPGKMLQEIFMMGFKCAFCYYALDMGTDFVTTYILNPIVITGTDIGNALLTDMLDKMSATTPATDI